MNAVSPTADISSAGVTGNVSGTLCVSGSVSRSESERENAARIPVNSSSSKSAESAFLSVPSLSVKSIESIPGTLLHICARVRDKNALSRPASSLAHIPADAPHADMSE